MTLHAVCALVLQTQVQAGPAAVDDGLPAVSTLSAPLSQRAHEHGFADLAIAQDGTHWWLELRLPLADLVGFERLPQNESEAAAILAAVRALANQSLQLQPACDTLSLDARLEPGGAIDFASGHVPLAPRTDPAPTDEHSHDPHGHDHDHDHDHDHERGHASSAHVDLYLTRTHRCSSGVPTGLRLGWPTEAGAQPRVRAQWLLESGQGGTQLQATDTQLRWARDD